MIRCLVVLAALAGAAVAGCADSSHGAVGSVEIALTATSASGASYRLPDSTQLVLENTGYVGQFPLDGDASSQLIDVPAGTYNVALANGPLTTTWPLTRVDRDGTISTVQGTLDLAATVDVVDGHTTGLTIRFHVGLTGVITFTSGTVAVTIAVDEDPATSFALGIQTTALQVTSAQAFAETPPDVASLLLPAQGATVQLISINAQTTGPWRVTRETQVCADAEISAYANGDSRLVTTVAESTPTIEPVICINQENAATASIVVPLFRRGPATTGALAALGDQIYTFDVSVTAGIAAMVFDGKTLDLRPLQATQPAMVLVTARVFGDLETGEVPWLQFLGDDGNAGTMSLSPL